MIEAGESDQKQIFSRIPAGWGNLWKWGIVSLLFVSSISLNSVLLFDRTPAEWNFETVPQEHCDNRKMYQPRGELSSLLSKVERETKLTCESTILGKMLGGCSSINAQCYQHCSPSDYDQVSSGWPAATRFLSLTILRNSGRKKARRDGDGKTWNLTLPKPRITPRILLTRLTNRNEGKEEIGKRAILLQTKSPRLSSMLP